MLLKPSYLINISNKRLFSLKIYSDKVAGIVIGIVFGRSIYLVNIGFIKG
jgi:hypothetical protein